MRCVCLILEDNCNLNAEEETSIRQRTVITYVWCYVSSWSSLTLRASGKGSGCLEGRWSLHSPSSIVKHIFGIEEMNLDYARDNLFFVMPY